MSSGSEVLFSPYPKQLEFINAVFSGKYDTLIYGGAFGGGKTYVACAILCMLARFYPNSKWIVLRRSMPDIERTVNETFEKILPSNYFKRLRSKPDIVYQGRNGSKIIFMAENYEKDPELNRFKSLECNGFFIEQIEEIQEKTFEMCHVRAGRWKVDSNPPRLIMASINPTQLWPKKRFYEPWVKEQLPTKTFYLPAKITDNPVLFEDKEYMAAFDHMDPIMKSRYLDGDWDAIEPEDQWAYNFLQSKHVAKGLTIDYTDTIYISFDFNVNPITCGILQHGPGWIHGIDEVRIENSNIWELAKKVATILYIDPENIPRVKVTGDFSGKNRTTLGNNYEEIRKTFNNHLEEIGSDFRYNEKAWWRSICVLSKNPFHVDSRTHVNAILYHMPELLIDERCKHLINDLQFVEAKPDGTIEKGSRLRPTQQADFLDLFRYYLHNFHYDWAKKLRRVG